MSRAVTRLSVLLTLLYASVSTLTSATSIPSNAAYQRLCFKHTNPMRPNERTPIPCALVDTPPQTKQALNGLKNLEAGAAPKFELQFVCLPVGDPICDKAKQTFQKAFAILEDTLILKQPVLVNATFFDFCKVLGQCGSDGFQILGGAAPQRSIFLEDLDKAVRAYPQALVKQLSLDQHPEYSDYDIFAQFNAAANFHFPSDTTPMGNTQSDFLFVVLHEMIHGLGFTSSWDDYINQTPQFLTPSPSGFQDKSGKYLFDGFVENIFDKYMYETGSGQPLSQKTAALNSIPGAGSATFTNAQAFASSITQSSQYRDVGGQVFQLATTAGTLEFRPTTGGPAMLLETSLSPYAPGSSVSHCDVKKYSTSSDYLMRFRVDPGVSLEKATALGGGGPIGPVLVNVLSTLGYATKQIPNPSPNARVTSPKPSAAHMTRHSTANLITALALSGSVALFRYIY